jgi:hypothetical protein
MRGRRPPWLSPRPGTPAWPVYQQTTRNSGENAAHLSQPHPGPASADTS